MVLSSSLTFRADSSAPPPEGSAGSNRLDVGRIDGRNIARTPQGGLKVPAYLTRSGVLTYRNADGSVRREYRPADEVFTADSLASLDDAPVTDLHPSAPVTPGNHAGLSKGHARNASRDGRFVAATIVVQDQATIEAIESGARKELSCGYSCKYDPTPGISPEGERYDGVQRNIVYNHVALLPIGAGRAGADVALRLDSSYQDEAPLMKTIRIDGKDVVVGSDEHLAYLAVLEAKQTARADAAEGRADAAEAKLTEANKALGVYKAAEAKAARTALEAQAATIVGTEVKFDGKSDREVREAVIKHAFPATVFEGKSDAYVEARYDSVIETPRADASASGAANVALLQSTLPATGSAGVSSLGKGDPERLEPWLAPLNKFSKVK